MEYSLINFSYDNSGAGFVFLVIVFILLYFFPTFIAYTYMHRNLKSLFVLNLFLGISYVGWVIALMWALWEYKEEYKEKEYKEDLT